MKRLLFVLLTTIVVTQNSLAIVFSFDQEDSAPAGGHNSYTNWIKEVVPLGNQPGKFDLKINLDGLPRTLSLPVLVLNAPIGEDDQGQNHPNEWSAVVEPNVTMAIGSERQSEIVKTRTSLLAAERVSTTPRTNPIIVSEETAVATTIQSGNKVTAIPSLINNSEPDNQLAESSNRLDAAANPILSLYTENSVYRTSEEPEVYSKVAEQIGKSTSTETRSVETTERGISRSRSRLANNLSVPEPMTGFVLLGGLIGSKYRRKHN